MLVNRIGDSVGQAIAKSFGILYTVTMGRETTTPRPGRRTVLTLGISSAAGLLGGGMSTAAPAAPTASAAPPTDPPSARKAWRLLQAGNARFAAGRPRHPHQDPAWRRSLADGQAPFACVLGCADSRVPPEIAFDCGLGDLFTVRAVGEVLDDAIIGSIEYAVHYLRVPLLVVLGHESCGAVTAAVELVQGKAEYSGDVSSVVRDIEATVRATPHNPDEEAFLAACVANQATRVGAQLRERSTIIGDAVDRRDLDIAAAVYDLDSGLVQRV